MSKNMALVREDSLARRINEQIPSSLLQEEEMQK
jgi:hypothetical protein